MKDSDQLTTQYSNKVKNLLNDEKGIEGNPLKRVEMEEERKRLVLIG